MLQSHLILSAPWLVTSPADVLPAGRARLQRPCGAAEAGGGLCSGRHAAAGIMRQALQPHPGEGGGAPQLQLRAVATDAGSRERQLPAQICIDTMQDRTQHGHRPSSGSYSSNWACHGPSTLVCIQWYCWCDRAVLLPPCRARRCRACSLAAAVCTRSRSATTPRSAAGRCWTTVGR